MMRKFELTGIEPWMEKESIIDEIRKLSSTQTVHKTLDQLGYPNIKKAKEALKRLGKKYDMDIRAEEKEGMVYIFNH